MTKKRIIFIINPISGGKSKQNIPGLIEALLDQTKYEYTISYTKYPGHAKELAAQNGFDFYVAVGGDGTLNEVASQLINTQKCMGILPMGSGNGLARHMGISMDVKQSIIQLNKAKIYEIDTCTLNGYPFINMAGVGFDAHIGKLFAESKERGFKTYIAQTLTEFKSYTPHKYKLIFDGHEIVSEAFLISFANSSQYGNNAHIAPKADIFDGQLNVCVMKPFNLLTGLGIGFKLFNKTINSSSYMKSFVTQELVVERETEGITHVDGEPIHMGKVLEIKVLPKSLKLLA